MFVHSFHVSKWKSGGRQKPNTGSDINPTFISNQNATPDWRYYFLQKDLESSGVKSTIFVFQM